MGPHFFMYHIPMRAINRNETNDPNNRGKRVPSFLMKGEKMEGMAKITITKPMMAAIFSRAGRVRVTGFICITTKTFNYEWPLQDRVARQYRPAKNLKLYQCLPRWLSLKQYWKRSTKQGKVKYLSMPAKVKIQAQYP